ncbi:primosomal protein N' [Paenalcaligenes niemegkensis]|uniref:primosomal protein N' n=1 Tax=Paenalcaligenes niemegkensis TaxID=2895469 RepID=UPI001EE81430|nr:primosomal protein N' [Paenalcaligenes niemegkensis]MCQ9617522.1 primosomal protein N' [Paenalcaligenes niemegkensis]
MGAQNTSVSASLDSQVTSRFWLGVALDVPIDAVFDYFHDEPVAVGCRVIVNFGRRKVIGVVVSNPDQPNFAADKVKAVDEVLEDTPPLSTQWLDMARFAASYYQRPLGEVILPVLPASLRKLSAYTGKLAAGGPVARLAKRKVRALAKVASDVPPQLNDEQTAAAAAILDTGSANTILLFGVTGSGKTEVYLDAALKVLARGKQVLFMVPEINLTPQFELALRRRLQHNDGEYELAVLHSGLSEGQRLRAWLAISSGQAKVLLGTRLSIFTPLPDLGLIIVDEEHDTSYKQQEGLRYSARDLAVWRGHQAGVPVVLGSATPSLESWAHAKAGRYKLCSLTHRARAVSMPDITLIDTRRAQLEQGFSPQLLKAIQHSLDQEQQALVFINRRGYSPVLNCSSCGWVSQCTRCSAYTVMHRSPIGRSYLQCHHCGFQTPTPKHCPDCRDQDLKPMGRGTQRIEEFLAEHFPAARIIRIDADSTRRKGEAEALFAQVHAGEVDILVGTQMVAKGHDFANLGLVVVLNADTMLFAQDFRAPERLFAQLMQVAGRAGRHTGGARVLIQTEYPEQSVYQSLIKHDYAGFAHNALAEREAIALPPFAFQALLTAESKELAVALSFLTAARDLPQKFNPALPGTEQVRLYDPVPLRIVRVANVERAQLLIESTHRPSLQLFLRAWGFELHQLGREHKVRWVLEVDPLEI